MQTKILIVNLHSVHNAGDRVLLEVTLDQLRENFPNSRLTLALNDLNLESNIIFPNRSEYLDIVPSFFAWIKRDSPDLAAKQVPSFYLTTIQLFLAFCSAILFRIFQTRQVIGLSELQRKTLLAYLDADMVVSCPGNFLYSRAHGGGLAILSPVFSIMLAWLAGKPLYMMPQTIGPLWRSWERWLIRWLLQRFRLIQVRDYYSRDLLQDLGIPVANIYVVPDLAFAFTASDLKAAESILDRYNVPFHSTQPLIGVTMIDWGGQHPRFTGQDIYELSVAATIRQFLQQNGGYVLLLSQVTGPRPIDDDRRVARRVQQLLKDDLCQTKVIVISEALDPSVLRALYALLGLLIGSRLHSNIFALSATTPVVAIAYQDKTHGVMEVAGLAKWVIDIDKVSEARLSAMVTAAWEQRNLLESHIQNTIPKLIEECQAAGRRICIDFQKLSSQSDAIIHSIIQ